MCPEHNLRGTRHTSTGMDRQEKQEGAFSTSTWGSMGRVQPCNSSMAPALPNKAEVLLAGWIGAQWAARRKAQIQPKIPPSPRLRTMAVTGTGSIGQSARIRLRCSWGQLVGGNNGRQFLGWDPQAPALHWGSASPDEEGQCDIGTPSHPVEQDGCLEHEGALATLSKGVFDN